VRAGEGRFLAHRIDTELNFTGNVVDHMNGS
jgi:hypothetical protein